MIKLIASDLDGTLLLNGAQDVSDQIHDQIRRMKDLGILFVASSGRQYTNLRHRFEPVKDEIAYIAENGALGMWKGECFFKRSLDTELAHRVIDALHSCEGCICMVSGERVCYTDSKEERFWNHMLNVVRNDMEYCEDLKALEEPYLKISACSFSGAEDPAEKLRGIFQDEIKITTSGNIWVDFITPGASKGHALRPLMEQLHISREESASFGDQYNDLEMLEATACSYVMESGAAGLEKHAVYKAKRVEDEIEKILRQSEFLASK
jgi:Cof subfamily protein (haloacid dehalogenase superfamily)